MCIDLTGRGSGSEPTVAALRVYRKTVKLEYRSGRAADGFCSDKIPAQFQYSWKNAAASLSLVMAAR